MAAKVDGKTGNTTTATKIKMGFKGGNYFPTGNTNGTVDITPELHMKMSKKIAQLTKVIYNLNTKNDEHDDIVQSLKEVHEEEMQKLAAETKEKVAHYRQKMELVKEQEQLITRLQDLLAEEQKEKMNFINDFEKFKREKLREKDECESRLKHMNETRLKELSKKIEDLKTEFENRTKQFETTKQRIEDEKDKVVSELTHAHSLETEKLIKAHRVRYDEVQKEKLRLEENYEKLLSENRAGSSNFELEKRELELEFNEKLEKLKGFYEKELDVLRTKEEESIGERTQELNDKIKLLSIQQKRSEDELKNTIRILKDDNHVKKEEITSLEQKLRKFQEELKKIKENSIYFKNMNSKLEEELSKAMEKQRDSDAKLITVRQRCEEQAAELLKKAAQVGTLEATKLSNEQSIKELHLEIKKLFSRCNDMERERETANKKLSSHSTEASKQIQALQVEMERLSKEKETTISKYEKLLTTTKEKHDHELQNLIAKSSQEIKRLETKHQLELDDLRRSILIENNETFQALSDKFVKKQKELENQNKLALVSKDEEIGKLERQLSNANNEVERLEKANLDNQKGLGSASSHITSLEESLKKAKQDLFETTEQLNAAKVKAEHSKNQLLSLQSEHLTKLQDSEARLKERLQQLTDELNDKWAKRLRKECQELRSELTGQYQEDNRAALEHLNFIKEQEYETLKAELQKEIMHLKLTISDLQRALDKSQKDCKSSDANHIEEMDKQRKKYEEEMAKQNFLHNIEIQKLKEENDGKIGQLSEQYNCDVNDLEKKLRAEHQEDMTAQLQANKAAIEAIKSQYEQKKKEEMNELQTTHAREKDVLREALFIQHQEEIERVSKQMELELASVKNDYEKSKELRRKEFDLHSSKIENLINSMSNKDETLKRLQKEVNSKEGDINQLRKELENKVEEIRSIRREANLQQRRREQQLAKQHRDELDSLTADHLRETQGILAEFNKGKELLKDKISALQLMLEQAEERYRNRESRPEDIETIQALKRNLTERELECRQLIEDKRYFQLELLNRETNFNKVFNSNPTVGVINPLEAGKKRKKAKQPWNSAGSRRSLPMSGSSSPARLDPLPHSQLHEQRLNSSKPLPGAPVKGH